MSHLRNQMDDSVQLLQEIEEVQLALVGETGSHVNRVAEYSYLIAVGLVLSHEEAKRLKAASPMHDIGKIGIPSTILNKPGKLNAEEYEIMKLHTDIGYGQLKDSANELLQAAAIVAYEHHEKWNGTGYPRGLKGEEIHIFGRITAIADVFDALSSKRVYKEAWDLERTIEVISSERGKHFDPRVVDVFLKQLPAILSIRERYQE